MESNPRNSTDCQENNADQATAIVSAEAVNGFSVQEHGLPDDSENLNINNPEVTLIGRDRMSMVMEESDEDLLDENNHPSAEELDAMLVRNSIVVEENDAIDDFDSMGSIADASLNHLRRSTALISNARAIDDNDVATEIEMQKPMGEQWGETNYATVLRLSSPRKASKLREEPSKLKIIPVRTAPEGSCTPIDEPICRRPVVIQRDSAKKNVLYMSERSPSQQTNNYSITSQMHYPMEFTSPKPYTQMQRSPSPIPSRSQLQNVVYKQVLENQPLANSSEHILELNDPSITITTIETSSHPVTLQSNSELATKVNSTEMPETNVTIQSNSETATVKGVIEPSNKQSMTEANSNSSAGMSVPNKTHDRSRCYVCGELVYILEAVYVLNRTYHKKCFRCHKCQRVLSVGNYSVGEGNPYCQPHYKEIFRVIGRYEGASMSNYNETALRQRAIQSNVPSETDRDRPPPQLTRTLVAKFQQMCTDYPLIDGRCTSSFGSDKQYNESARNSGTYASPFRSSMLSMPISAQTPVPTPFQQASQLKQLAQRTNSLQPVSKSSEQSPVRQSVANDEDLPNPGITRDMVAKFSALFAT